MTHRAAAIGLVAILVALGGCQRESKSGGGGGGAAVGSALDYPADTTLLLGFVRKGPAPSAAELTAAMTALLREDPDREIKQMIDACMAPLSAHLERTTLVVRGALKDERVVAFASGPGLRPALESCFRTMQAARGKPFEPEADGDFTLYALSGDPIVARWTGTDEAVLAASKQEIESATAAAGGLRGTPLEKVAGAVDRASAFWFAAAGPGLPDEASIESASGTVQDLTGSLRVVFETPEAANAAVAMIQTRIPKGVKVAGREVAIGLNLADLPAIVISTKPSGPPQPPLSHDHARALLAAGPLMVAFLLVADGGDQSAPTTTAPPAEPVAPPAEPVAPPTP